MLDAKGRQKQALLNVLEEIIGDFVHFDDESDVQRADCGPEVIHPVSGVKVMLPRYDTPSIFTHRALIHYAFCVQQ